MTINLHSRSAGIRDETGRTGAGRNQTQDGAGQIGAGQIAAGQIGTGQIGTGQIGAGQIGAGQIAAGQIAAGRDGAGGTGGRRGRWLTGLGAVGVGYSLSWIAGLSVSAPSPAFGASGRQIVTAFAGHGAALATQFALTEGLPSVGIAVVTVALARAGRARGEVTAARFALASGLLAAIISALQFGLGLVLATTSSPGTAHLAFAAVNRMDGSKMLALAVLGAAAAAMTLLPAWLRITGIALAVSITVSGVVYLLLLSSLTAAAGPALVLLLIFITGCGIIIGMQKSAAPRRDS
jgi:hypothetical protein